MKLRSLILITGLLVLSGASAYGQSLFEPYKFGTYPIEQISPSSEIQPIEFEIANHITGGQIDTFLIQNVHWNGKPWTVYGDASNISTWNGINIWNGRTINEHIVPLFYNTDKFMKTPFGKQVEETLEKFADANMLYIGDRLIFKPACELMQKELRDNYRLNVVMGAWSSPMPFLEYLRALTDLAIEADKFEWSKKQPVPQEIEIYQPPHLSEYMLKKYGKQAMTNAQIVGAPSYRYRGGYGYPDGKQRGDDETPCLTISQNWMVNGKTYVVKNQFRPLNDDQVLSDYGYFWQQYLSTIPKSEFQYGFQPIGDSNQGAFAKVIANVSAYSKVLDSKGRPIRDKNGKELRTPLMVRVGTPAGINEVEATLAYPWIQRQLNRMKREYRWVEWSPENWKLNILDERYFKYADAKDSTRTRDFETDGWNYYITTTTKPFLRTVENKRYNIPGNVPYRALGFLSITDANSNGIVPKPLQSQIEIENQSKMGKEPIFDFSNIKKVWLEAGRGPARNLFMASRRLMPNKLRQNNRDYLYVNGVRHNPECQYEIEAGKDVTEVMDVLIPILKKHEYLASPY